MVCEELYRSSNESSKVFKRLVPNDSLTGRRIDNLRILFRGNPNDSNELVNARDSCRAIYSHSVELEPIVSRITNACYPYPVAIEFHTSKFINHLSKTVEIR